MQIEIRLFNSLTRYRKNDNPYHLRLPAAATVGDALAHVEVPESEIFLLTHNGRNIMRGFGFNSGIEIEHRLADGDVLSFSGPIPFSRGYGSPVI